MILSGIADEAGKDLSTQIRAHQELGWKFIELRTIDGENITDISDEKFAEVVEALGKSQIKVSCFASQLANWARPIDGQLETDICELERSIPRMQILGTQYIRCMSYPNCDPPLDDADWRKIVLERMRELANLAEEGGVILAHENCHGWAGRGAQQMLDMIEEVDSDNLKLLFDTGNPAYFNDNSLELFHQIKEHVDYIHIKDYRPAPEGTEPTACFPGQGVGDVQAILSDLVNNEYEGFISIEPHIDSVIHLDQDAEDPIKAFETYVDYGKALEGILNQIATSA